VYVFVYLETGLLRCTATRRRLPFPANVFTDVCPNPLHGFQCQRRSSICLRRTIQWQSHPRCGGTNEPDMTSKAIEEAFQRHPRPQVPTNAGLLQQPVVPSQAAPLQQPPVTPKAQRPPVPTKAALLQRAIDDRRRTITYQEVRESPWNTLTRQGDLVQGKHVWSICTYKRQLVMVRELAIEAGRRQLEMLKRLSDHPHVSTIKQAFETNDSIFFQLEYSRYTLEEVLSVHICLEESHIRVIASAVSERKFSSSSRYS
jgi:serine/threonine protein kinase